MSAAYAKKFIRVENVANNYPKGHCDVISNVKQVEGFQRLSVRGNPQPVAFECPKIDDKLATVTQATESGWKVPQESSLLCKRLGR